MFSLPSLVIGIRAFLCLDGILLFFTTNLIYYFSLDIGPIGGLGLWRLTPLVAVCFIGKENHRTVACKRQTLSLHRYTM
jgi:hypothetical protein